MKRVDKLDVDKVSPVPKNLSKLSDVVRNEVVQNTDCNTKIKDIEDKIPDITDLATNTALNAKINEVKNEVPSTTNLATNDSLNTKPNEFKNKLPNITNVATSTALTAAENKIPTVGKKCRLWYRNKQY